MYTYSGIFNESFLWMIVSFNKIIILGGWLMLSKEQKEKLRKIHIYEVSNEEKKGKAIV